MLALRRSTVLRSLVVAGVFMFCFLILMNYVLPYVAVRHNLDIAWLVFLSSLIAFVFVGCMIRYQPQLKPSIAGTLIGAIVGSFSPFTRLTDFLTVACAGIGSLIGGIIQQTREEQKQRARNKGGHS